jgi:hypothetical protein
MIYDGIEFAVLAAGALTTVVWWGFRRVVEQQKELTIQMNALAISIAKICGNVEQGLLWQTMHADLDNVRDNVNVKEHANLQASVERVRVEMYHKEKS